VATKAIRVILDTLEEVVTVDFQDFPAFQVIQEPVAIQDTLVIRLFGEESGL